MSSGACSNFPRDPPKLACNLIYCNVDVDNAFPANEVGFGEEVGGMLTDQCSGLLGLVVVGGAVVLMGSTIVHFLNVAIDDAGVGFGNIPFMQG